MDLISVLLSSFFSSLFLLLTPLLRFFILVEAFYSSNFLVIENVLCCPIFSFLSLVFGVFNHFKFSIKPRFFGIKISLSSKDILLQSGSQSSLWELGDTFHSLGQCVFTWLPAFHIILRCCMPCFPLDLNAYVTINPFLLIMFPEYKD